MAELLDAGRAVFAIDWASNYKNMAVVSIGRGGKIIPYQHRLDLESFLNGHPNAFIILECSFESIDLEKRNRLIIIQRQNGNPLHTIAPRSTANLRIKYGFGDRKTNEIDAHMIACLWLEGHHFKAASTALTGMERVREIEFWMKLKRPYVLLRSWGWPKNEVSHFLATLPPIDLMGDETFSKLACVIDDDGKYVPSIVMAAIIPAIAASGKKEFRRLVGNWGNGKPSVFRSAFYVRVEALAKRDLGGIKSFTGVKNWDDIRKKREREMSKAFHTIFQKVKATGAFCPIVNEGISYPVLPDPFFYSLLFRK